MIFLKALWHYLLTAGPYLMMGLALSGLIHAFVPLEKIKNFLGKRRKRDILYASMVGVPLPLCSCSVVPTAITIKQAGASNGATSAFLISTPESGIDSIIMTKGLMDWPMTLIRPIAAFTSGFFAGLLQLILNEETQHGSHEKHQSCCAHKEANIPQKTSSILAKLEKGFEYAFVDLVNDFSNWMIVGILSGALIEVFVPNHFFQSMELWQSKLLIILIGVPLYVCASASTPIAASMVLKGLSPGAALLFLLVGPATNISNILVMQKYIGKKGVLINVFAIVSMALFFSLLTDYLYQNYFSVNFAMSHESTHQHGTYDQVQIICAILMSGLLLKGAYASFFQKHKH